MRVLLGFGRDGEEPRLVLVAAVVSRLCMSSGVLAGGLAGADCSSTSLDVAKGICPLLLLLQVALWAEVLPADAQHIEGLNGQSGLYFGLVGRVHGSSGGLGSMR